MKGTTKDLPHRACLTCGGDYQPVKPKQKYCQPEHRPSARTIALRLSPEALVALAKAHQVATRRGLMP